MIAVSIRSPRLAWFTSGIAKLKPTGPSSFSAICTSAGFSTGPTFAYCPTNSSSEIGV